ncbi:MAG: hypothetical protein AAFR93_14285 [Pseudomonadota bacterium]
MEYKTAVLRAINTGDKGVRVTFYQRPDGGFCADARRTAPNSAALGASGDRVLDTPRRGAVWLAGAGL